MEYERFEQECSTHILTDLLLQGINEEGRLNWRGKQISIVPSKLGHDGTIDKYRLYSAVGEQIPQINFDRDRKNIRSGRP